MTDRERYLGAMRVVEDAAEVARAGGWVIDETTSAAQVGGFVPERFEDYARIFHPAMREADEVTWREVAEANGKVAHPAMQWTSITGSYEFGWHGMQPGLWDEVPQHESLPLRLTGVLCEILAGFTSTPEQCWFAVWEGYGDVVGLREDLNLPRLEMPHRPMILAWGPLSRVADKSFTDGFPDPHGASLERYRSPSLWWPDDQAWCVATDVDMQETYLGASVDCVDRLIDDGRLEVMRVVADQGITFDSDTINPTPTGDRSKA